MSLRNSHHNLLSRISGTMSADATRLHNLDLERLGRSAAAAWELQDMLADLKGRIARRAVRRAQGSSAMAGMHSLAA
jgi:hypothetical protein